LDYSLTQKNGGPGFADIHFFKVNGGKVSHLKFRFLVVLPRGITNVYITGISLGNEKGGIQITLFLCPRACEHHSPSLPYSYFLARVPVAPDICFCSTLEEETVRFLVTARSHLC
jgi:hypothetical protein